MDSARFDALARILSSRRIALGGLLGSLASLLHLADVVAAPCPQGKTRCGKRCIPKRRCCSTANCRKGSGKVCRRGRCVCPPSKKRCGSRCIPKAACCRRCLPGQTCRKGVCCYPTTAAFQAALGPGGPAVIRLCAGTAYVGTFQVPRSVTVIGAGPTSTILNGGATGPVVEVPDDVPAVELRGLQITNGRTIFAGAGLLVNERAAVTLRGCLVRGNGATGSGTGGGFANVGTLVLIDTVVSGNAAGGGGGGMANSGTSACTLLLRGTTRIEGNQALEGGGLQISGDLTRVELREGSIVTGNAANAGNPESGGGIHVDPATSPLVLFFDRSRVTANTPNNCTGATCPS